MQLCKLSSSVWRRGKNSSMFQQNFNMGYCLTTRCGSCPQDPWCGTWNGSVQACAWGVGENWPFLKESGTPQAVFTKPFNPNTVGASVRREVSCVS